MTAQLIQFTKMHGLGNDFVVINALTMKVALTPKDVSALADRHTGIGFDQLLVIAASEQGNYFCRIFNADGSEAEQCGNGLRCVARFIHEEKINDSNRFLIATKAGTFQIEITDYDHIRVALGRPHIKKRLGEWVLPHSGQTVPISVLSLGNPHAIIKLDTLEQFPLAELASHIATPSFFPDGINIGFMQIMGPHHIRLRTFERGVGETCACGSNACAAAAAGIYNGWLKQPVQVTYRYGPLLVEWDGGNGPMYLTGPAARVYAGSMVLAR